jgi:DNA-binding LacI/PurR family transcriptional regulator
MGEGSKNKRLTIGLAIDDIVLAGGQKSLRTVVELARERDVNLLCFHLDLNDCAHRMPSSWDAMGEIPDGLIVSQAWRREELFTAMRNHFPSIPMVNAARPYKGCPGTAPDSYGGMREILRHLLEVHGHKRIAFIRGPAGGGASSSLY